MGRASKTVTVVMTVRNEPAGCAVTLDSLATQTRPADEIIVVDGGSTDGTVSILHEYATGDSRIRLIEAAGANIACGRNIGTQNAIGEVVATIDSGCRAEPGWLDKLVRPFEDDPETEFAAGFYRIEPRTLLEEVVGLATMRGQLDPVRPETFNPSGRSMAYTKALWSRAGGWPEWLFFSEDTLFDHKIRRMDVKWRFVGDAIVRWRPRGSLPSIAKQFYNYGTGRGHTRIDASSFAYNVRNLALVLIAAGLSLFTKWAIPVAVLLICYFYIWTFHHKAVRVARRTRRWIAYPMCQCVMWVVLASNLCGYLVGSWQRRRDRKGYQYRMEAYLTSPSGLASGE